ncbi:MAG: hypothetical protein KDD64_05030 [Bdellovibrionales bacterium]|nr:hypothetical protein [Bdellovibrionales bacterium]
MFRISNLVVAVAVLFVIPQDLFAANAKVKLVVKRNAYEVSNEVVCADEVDGFKSTPGVTRIESCNDPILATDGFCTIVSWHLASFHCDVFAGLDGTDLQHALELQIDAESGSDHASNLHSVDNIGCLNKIKCGYSRGWLDTDELAGVQEVELAPGAWCVNSTSEIYCESERSGCDQDGVDCTYKVKCIHRNN